MKKIYWLTLVAVVAPAVVFALVGCMKVPSTDVDKGIPADCKKLDSAVDQLSVGKVESIQKNEFSYREVVAQLDILAPEVMSQVAYTVTDRRDNANGFEIDLHREINERTDGSVFKDSTKNFTFVFTRAQSSPTTQSNAAHVLEKRMVKTQADTESDDSFCSASGTSYFNLKTENSVMPVPDIVRKRDDCGGLGSCTAGLKTLKLSFDSWQKDESGTDTKYTHRVVASPDVPYFSAMMSNCLTYPLALQGRNILVTQCSDVKDFTFGHKTP